MAAATDLKSVPFGGAGSSPASGTRVLSVQFGVDAALSRRRSPVRVRYGTRNAWKNGRVVEGAALLMLWSS
jgi:hypothetical protein